ncbi:hypothetical protein DK843_00255 [Chromobacterium phragmitis]|uniref:Uncharacterized protein n=1 Tax=Chromobacterium phragmitis TaxID=2202141 RepID=A0A344UC73_9NEIS|nr:hypothetical protein DK843_00255 [Chromobacterium phragmitis]
MGRHVVWQGQYICPSVNLADFGCDPVFLHHLRGVVMGQMMQLDADFVVLAPPLISKFAILLLLGLTLCIALMCDGLNRTIATKCVCLHI